MKDKKKEYKCKKGIPCGRWYKSNAEGLFLMCQEKQSQNFHRNILESVFIALGNKYLSVQEKK